MDYDNAHVQFQRALEFDPRSLPAQVGMSIVMLQTERTQAALRHLERTTTAKP